MNHLGRGHLGGLAIMVVAVFFFELFLAGCSTAIGEVERPVSAEILKRAETEGSVRVIVELRVDRQEIRLAQDEVLRVLEGTGYRVTRRYTQIPFLGLEVSPKALRLLATSPSVLRIQEDRVGTPQEDKTP